MPFADTVRRKVVVIAGYVKIVDPEGGFRE